MAVNKDGSGTFARRHLFKWLKIQLAVLYIQNKDE